MSPRDSHAVGDAQRDALRYLIGDGDANHAQGHAVFLRTPEGERNEVLRLEERRIDSGYAPGWTYYQAKDKGILSAFLELQEAGQLHGRRPAPAGVRDPDRSDQKQLTVELVPSSCWYSNVRSNVPKRVWDDLRHQTYRQAANRCEICGGRGPEWPVEAHEIWHYDDANAVQRLDGLIALCPSCHEVKHMGLAQLNGREKEAKAHLSRVNGWSEEETESYVDDQFATWSRRSDKQWTLDVSWLQQFGIDISPSEADRESQEEEHALSCLDATDPRGSRDLPVVQPAPRSELLSLKEGASVSIAEEPRVVVEVQTTANGARHRTFWRSLARPCVAFYNALAFVARCLWVVATAPWRAILWPFRALARRRRHLAWEMWNGALVSQGANGAEIVAIVNVRQDAKTGTKCTAEWIDTGEQMPMWIPGVFVKPGYFLAVKGSSGWGRHHKEEVFFVNDILEVMPPGSYEQWRQHERLRRERSAVVAAAV